MQLQLEQSQATIVRRALLSDPDNLSRHIDNARAVKSFRYFAEKFWPMIDPNPWRGGWHIDCKCDHLQAVSNGEIDRLRINEPPRHSKSS